MSEYENIESSAVYISSYSELCAEPNGYPSLKDSFSNMPHPKKEEIVSFLKGGGRSKAIAGTCDCDVFTNERIAFTCEIRESDKYVWSTSLVHYFERYNLELPEDFVKYILATGVYRSRLQYKE